MLAYIAFLIDIRDRAAFTSYARAAAPTYALYGGSVALRGPIVDIIEGNLEAEPDTRLVVLQFPSLLRARAWWHSPQYQRRPSSAAHRSQTAARSSSTASTSPTRTHRSTRNPHHRDRARSAPPRRLARPPLIAGPMNWSSNWPGVVLAALALAGTATKRQTAADLSVRSPAAAGTRTWAAGQPHHAAPSHSQQATSQEQT